MGYPFGAVGAVGGVGGPFPGTYAPSMSMTGAFGRSAGLAPQPFGAQDGFQATQDEEAGGQPLGLNLGGLLGQDPQHDNMQQNNMQQMLAMLMLELEMLISKLQQQMQANDQQGAADTQNQINDLQNQIAPMSGGGSGPSGAPMSGGGSSQPYPGGGSSSGGGSAPSSTGDSSGAPGAGAVNVDPNSMGDGTAWGKQLAAEAFSHAGPASQGLCYKFVGEDLRKFGVETSGEGAYMAADQLAKCDKFQEARGLSNQDLTKLPAGAVVVWNRGNGHEWGHISIADGHGHEASDFKGNQITNYGTSFRVFLPKGSQQSGH